MKGPLEILQQPKSAATTADEKNHAKVESDMISKLNQLIPFMEKNILSCDQLDRLGNFGSKTLKRDHIDKLEAIKEFRGKNRRVLADIIKLNYHFSSTKELGFRQRILYYNIENIVKEIRGFASNLIMTQYTKELEMKKELEENNNKLLTRIKTVSEQFNESQTKLKTVSEQYNESQTELKTVSNRYNQAQTKINSLEIMINEQSEINERKLAEQTKEIKKQADTINEQEEKIDVHNIQIAGHKDRVEKLENESKNQERENKESKEQIHSLIKQIQEMRVEMQSLSKFTLSPPPQYLPSTPTDNSGEDSDVEESSSEGVVGLVNPKEGEVDAHKEQISLADHVNNLNEVDSIQPEDHAHEQSLEIASVEQESKASVTNSTLSVVMPIPNIIAEAGELSSLNSQSANDGGLADEWVPLQEEQHSKESVLSSASSQPSLVSRFSMFGLSNLFSSSSGSSSSSSNSVVTKDASSAPTQGPK